MCGVPSSGGLPAFELRFSHRFLHRRAPRRSAPCRGSRGRLRLRPAARARRPRPSAVDDVRRLRSLHLVVRARAAARPARGGTDRRRQRPDRARHRRHRPFAHAPTRTRRHPRRHARGRRDLPALRRDALAPARPAVPGLRLHGRDVVAARPAQRAGRLRRGGARGGVLRRRQSGGPGACRIVARRR